MRQAKNSAAPMLARLSPVGGSIDGNVFENFARHEIFQFD